MSKRAVVAAVQLTGVSDLEFESSLSELRELAKTLGFEVVGTFTQKRTNFDSTAYLGTGKRDEMRRFVQGENASDPTEEEGVTARTAKGGSKQQDKKVARHGIVAAREAAKALAESDTRRAAFVLVDHEISPSQARNLENEIGCDVLDRTMVILEIFHRHARSNAARAQVEIARLRYLAPRLREAAKLAGPQGRQRSGVGGRGAGEGAGEADRAKIRDRIAELKQEITALDLERQVQRARRQETQGLARVVLIGYTNAGKSTLMRALTGSEVLVANKLFATLDTTVRKVVVGNLPFLLTDTVGFIRKLPTQLVESFKSTLDEVREADILLHVVDVAHPNYEDHMESVASILQELGCQDTPQIVVFNKIDAWTAPTDDEGRSVGSLDELQSAWVRRTNGQCVFISALHKDQFDALREMIYRNASTIHAVRFPFDTFLY